MAFDSSERAAADAICEMAGIESRSELKSDADARKTFFNIVDRFKGETR
jgi:hypothetical protein